MDRCMDGRMDGWMLPPGLWAMEAADAGRGGAGTGGEFGMLSASCPPCFHLVQIGRRMEITLELSRFVLGKEGVDVSSVSDKTELFRQTLAELTSSCSPTR